MSRKRRKYSRVRAPSLVAHLHLDGKLVGGGAVENISAGGLLVRTGQQLPSGAAVQLDLVRPGMKKPFRLPGWVVGASGAPPALRIQFDLTADSAAARLHGLLNELGLREVVEPNGAAPGSTDAPEAGAPSLPAADSPLAEIELSPAEIVLSVPELAPTPAASPRPAPASAAVRPPLLAGPPVLVPQQGLPPRTVADAAATPRTPGGPVDEALSLQQQVRALQEELRQARQQLVRHEYELGLLRAEMSVRKLPA